MRRLFPLLLLVACAQSGAVDPVASGPDLGGAGAAADQGLGGGGGDAACAAGTAYRVVPEASFLGNAPVRGLCVAEVSYCSASGEPSLQRAPAGFLSDVSAPGGCDYNGCLGERCQQNFCKDCQGDCAKACPR